MALASHGPRTMRTRSRSDAARPLNQQSQMAETLAEAAEILAEIAAEMEFGHPVLPTTGSQHSCQLSWSLSWFWTRMIQVQVLVQQLMWRRMIQVLMQQLMRRRMIQILMRLSLCELLQQLMSRLYLPQHHRHWDRHSLQRNQRRPGRQRSRQRLQRRQRSRQRRQRFHMIQRPHDHSGSAEQIMAEASTPIAFRSGVLSR